MTSAPSQTNSGLELFALTPSGPRALTVAATTGTMHDAMDPLPDGVYSALRTFRGNRFLELEAHLERTQQSMHVLAWKKTLDRKALRAALNAIVGRNTKDVRVRFDVLPEPFELQGVRADVFVGVSPHTELPQAWLKDGVRVDYARNLSRTQPRVKTTKWVKDRRPFPIGTQEQLDQLLVDPEGRILEFTSANIAFVRGDELLSAGDGVLDGITQRVLARLASQIGLKPRHVRLPENELATVDEAILSSSVRGPVPVVKIEALTIGSGRPGPKTKELVTAYYACADREARMSR
ncbi:MAG: aminotransferase class IV [Planctomycetes bacterium]|nr:aminotransferase class IV [Planctomycetota bacterium]